MLEEEIIKRAIGKDRQAFRLIFSTYKDKVYRTAFIILKDYQHAEDVVQETFLQVHLKIHKLYNYKAFEGWLYKITVNNCFNLLRQKGKLELVELDMETESLYLTAEDDYDIPVNLIIQSEIQEEIMNSIYSLPLKNRTVLTLYYFNEFRIKEISEILKCSEGTVKSRLFYGKKILKKLLIEDDRVIQDLGLGGVVYENR